MRYREERDPAVLIPHLATIRSLADAERQALGFLSEATYRDAIVRRRLVAMMTCSAGQPQVVGFALISGVFPDARIQQVVVAPDHRCNRVATALLAAVLSGLEIGGYLRVTAAVADDLPIAQAFYERNGFTARSWRPGGRARRRTIVVRARDLANETLLSVLEPSASSSARTIDIGSRLRAAGTTPLYVIDLNVLFDAVRGERRPRAADAELTFAAALAHRFRLAVAREFVVELERTTRGPGADPMLSLAKRLPRLAAADPAEEDRLADIVHAIVFGDAPAHEAESPQSISDASHLAQAALARASGYITSDGRMLDARARLFDEVEIDVAGLDEFAMLLGSEPEAPDPVRLVGTDLAIRAAPREEVRAHLQAHRVADRLIGEFATGDGSGRWSARAVIEAGEVVAVGVHCGSAAIDATSRLLLHVRTDHVDAALLADGLLHAQCAEACCGFPVTIELTDIPGQFAVRQAALLVGFVPIAGAQTLTKVALGRPVTARSWPVIAPGTRRRTGLRLPETSPTLEDIERGIAVQGPDGRTFTVRLPALEDALAPTVLAWPGRDGVIVSIKRVFADGLLATGVQADLFGRAGASFGHRRTYLSSPRGAPLMRPGIPILYASSRTGGRGAIVAIGRIVDSVITPKSEVAVEVIRRTVIEDVEPLSTSGDLLATNFDNVLIARKPVTLDQLRGLGAKGSSNLQSPTAVTAERLGAIVDLGWPGG